jgi:aminoglycoside phosphotransferase (APT) family kinase protein
MTPMPAATATRLRWHDLPAHVRAAVEETLGDHVVEAVSQAGGFSPGTADRVVTADGRRAFVKAVSSAQNPRTPELHRQEAVVSGAMPAGLPVPALLGVHDDGEWVALVLEDVEGRHPVTPWLADELHATLRALGDLAHRLTPSPVPDLPTARQLLGADLDGWSRVAQEPPTDLDPWAATHLDLLLAMGRRGVESLRGDTVSHADVRADNLLIRPDGTVVVVDWPWACVGAPWLDTVALLASVERHGGHDVDALVETYVGASADPDDVTAFLAALAGYFVDMARRPAPQGLPTVRAAQAAQGRATLAWVRRRVSG